MKRAMKLVLFGAWIECAGASVAGGQNVGHVPAAPASLSPKPSPLGATSLESDTTVTRRRPRAIEYSDWYGRRLTIHRIGSYVELPLFATQWYLGNKVLNGSASSSERDLHTTVAGGLGVLFGVNTVTGVWNLYDSRKDPSDRKKKIIHSALMLASDAGFAAAGLVGRDANGDRDRRNLHRNIALSSIGMSTAGTLMMWFWKD